MKDTDKIIAFETAKLAKEKGYIPQISKLENFVIGCYNAEGEYAFRNYYNRSKPCYLGPEKQELQEWLIKNKILVLVDYCYECTSASYFYKIYKFVDEHGKCEKWPVKGVRYDNKGTEIEETVCYRDYKRSYSDYETYSDALEAGLYEALTMLETKTIDVTEERNINIKNGVYIENNTGIINI